MAHITTLNDDIAILIEHLESRGFVIDTLLMAHITKINNNLKSHDGDGEKL